MSIKRQLRQWKYEISQFWGRFDFWGRLVFGAAISLGMVLFANRMLIVPLNKDIVSLTRNLIIPDNLDIAKSEEIAMNREKTKNIATGVSEWSHRFEKLRSSIDPASETRHAEIITDIQRIFDRCGVLIRSELFVQSKPTEDVRSIVRNKRKGNEIAAASPSKPIESYVHTYTVAGSFRRIQAALLLIERLPYALTLSEFRLVSEKDQVHAPLELSFRLDIRYIREDALGL